MSEKDKTQISMCLISTSMAWSEYWLLELVLMSGESEQIVQMRNLICFGVF